MLTSFRCFNPANVWTHENRISSDSNTQNACLPWLPDGAIELIGHLMKVDGKTSLNGVFKHEPFQPDSRVTTDAFDQVQLYYTLNNAAIRLMKMGFNLRKTIANRRGEDYKVTAHANATESLNAWYSPQDGELTFGTNNGKWHLASDGDVSVHEFGHLILDHYNPGLTSRYSGEGGAIHEGFADALAALHYDDPEMSEDFVPHKGGTESKRDGLRIVDNDLTLSDVSDEVHDRGQVYGGFWWSIKKTLTDPEGPFKLTSREACNVTLMLLTNHASNYKTSRPAPADFVKAVIQGMYGLAKEMKLGVDSKLLGQAIIAEGIKRKMIKNVGDAAFERGKFRSVNDVQQYMIQRGVDADFTKTHESDFIGGIFEFYQQQISSTKYGSISIVNSGILMQKDSNGNIISLSTKDILPIGGKQIDDSGNIDLEQAISLALSRAGIEFRNLSNSGDKTERIISRSDLLNLKRMSNSLQSGKKPEARVVLIQGSLVPHFELKTGLSIYYVNTKTGAVTKQKDIIVD